MGVKVTGKPVAGGYGAAGQQQFQCHRPANDIGRAHHHSLTTVKRLAGRFQYCDYAAWRAGAQQWPAQRQPADIVGMESINVLVRANTLRDLVRVDLCRQRKLHQDAVDFRILVQGIDQFQQLDLGCVVGKIIGA
jgi:hypothetical protein